MENRGRPSMAAGPKVTKQQLTAIAASMIGKKGVANTSLRSIAAEAGVSLAALQHYFPNKASLLAEIIDELIVPFEKSRSSEGMNIDEYFVRVIQARLDNFISTPGLTGRILSGQEGEEEVLVEYLASQIKETVDSDHARITRAIKNQSLRKIQPLALMTLVGVAITALTSSHKALHKLFNIDIERTRDRNKLTKGITDIILYGILPREKEVKR